MRQRRAPIPRDVLQGLVSTARVDFNIPCHLFQQSMSSRAILGGKSGEGTLSSQTDQRLSRLVREVLKDR
jgi:hypothetical protein